MDARCIGSAFSASGVVALTGSAMPIVPPPAVDADEDRGRAVGAQVVGLRRKRCPPVDTLFFEKAGIAATSLRLPSTVPVIALADRLIDSAGSLIASPLLRPP
jgi:hypothetical protein